MSEAPTGVDSEAIVVAGWLAAYQQEYTDTVWEMPWIAIIFGLFVGPYGVLSVMLVVMQPVLYNAFCTLCLVSAVISLAMIGPAMDEVLASMQYVRDAGGSVWSAFWGREHRFVAAAGAEEAS